MANLNINIPDPMKEFVDREIGSGRFKDASDFMQLLIAEAMEAHEIEFSEAPKNGSTSCCLNQLIPLIGANTFPFVQANLRNWQDASSKTIKENARHEPYLDTVSRIDK